MENTATVSQSLANIQQKAHIAFQNELPLTSKLEAWKYTPISWFEKIEIQPENEPAITSEGIETYALSEFADQFPKELTCYFNTLNKADKTYLQNTANFQEGIVIRIPKNKVLDTPIIIRHGANKVQFARLLVIVEENASATIQEFYTEELDNYTNSVQEIFIHDNAQLTHHKVQTLPDTSKLIDHTFVHQRANSRYQVDTFSLSGAFIRNNLEVTYLASYATCHLNGLFLPMQTNQVIDNHVQVNHLTPDCESNQLYKGILDEKSIGVFNGKVYVKKDAQKTNAFQSNKNILLSDEPNIYTKPELEIYADDVKCSHGATTGQLDDAALFYLKARGIPHRKAVALLTRAYAEEVIEKLRDEGLKERIQQLVEDKLSRL